MGGVTTEKRQLSSSTVSLPGTDHQMDVFLMIQRRKTTIFTDAKENSTVFELKCIIESILKQPPREQKLFKNDQLLKDSMTLLECGFTGENTPAEAPALLRLAFLADEISAHRS
ncbi:elongin-B-like [Erinaceus europaeus]|uniref:Elongin-B-like n=1 Tax=Erinaceus europaeus TaxID=9365 RepID=A0ABM3YGX9_ERIEU|nr:elongin-B-like [Erinaceus europaeus]